jgi:DNA-3-methyladenine glycosylase
LPSLTRGNFGGDFGSLEALCAGSACDVAPRLIGCRLACRDGTRWRTGVIVETEAYPGGPDVASHTFGGRRTKRTAAMWLRGGHAYVYFVYGMHFCVNVVTGPEGAGEAVLVRALEPVEGLDAMRTARGNDRDRDLCRGPARLTEALGISRVHDGHWLLGDGPLRLLPPAKSWIGDIACGPRIGVDYAGPWAAKRWRHWVRDSRWISR